VIAMPAPIIPDGLNPNKLSGTQVHAHLRSLGLSKLDASLITDCVNVHKSCSWQNNEEATDSAVATARKFLAENKLGVDVVMAPARFGKYIWEVTLAKH